jgi:FtsP/CotA-like multicopper oxidase with cupredoxin domain
MPCIAFWLLMLLVGHSSMFQDPFNLINETILLNGIGNVTRFNSCTDPKGNPTESCTNTIDIPKPFTIVFDKSRGLSRPKRYLLRIINTSYETQFVFSIDNHNLTVIGADFVPIHNYSTHSLLVGIGQRYHIVVEANPIGPHVEHRTDFWIRTGVAKCFDKRNKVYPEGYDATGILRYDCTSNAFPSSSPWTDISLDCMDEPVKNLIPIVPWIVGPAANNQSSGEERDVTFDDQDGTWPLANFSLELPTSTTFDPLRINYSDPIFFHLNQNSMINRWPTPWVVIPENFNDTDWVRCRP